MSTHAKVLIRLVDEPLVNFVHNAQNVPFDAQLTDEFELALLEHLPERIIRRVDDYRLCAAIEFRCELLLVEKPVG